MEKFKEIGFYLLIMKIGKNLALMLVFGLLILSAGCTTNDNAEKLKEYEMGDLVEYKDETFFILWVSDSKYQVSQLAGVDESTGALLFEPGEKYIDKNQLERNGKFIRKALPNES
jgi:hypothetical protein